MEASSLYTCSQCGKEFGRRAHFLRHQQQHSGDRPYSCQWCSKSYKRSDVLRDHFGRCERRGTSAIPDSLERGRKRKACFACARLKIKCDEQTPCRKCEEFGRHCVKGGSTGVASSLVHTPHTLPSTPEQASDRNSIGFLLNCPGDSDFLQEFPKTGTLSPNDGKQEHSPSVSSAGKNVELQPETGGHSTMYEEHGNMAYEHNLEVFLSNLDFQTFEAKAYNWQMPLEDSISGSDQDGLFLNRGVLEHRAFDIRKKLEYAASMMNLPHAPSTETIDAINVITAENIAAYVKLYFKHWHKHAPMVHEPSFNPCAAALPLVLSLMGLGAMYSKDRVDVSKIKSILDVIEAYIYSTPGLNDEYELPGRVFVPQGGFASPEWQQYQLEEIQGACLIIVLQYWTGNPTAQTRVRQQRFTRYVSIFHHLDMGTIQQAPGSEIKDQLSFANWIRKESYIRTATFSIMLDHAFGIFNNVPSRIQFAELDVSFPSDDGFFQISDYKEMIATASQPKSSLKIKDAFLALFAPPETADEDLNFVRNGNITAQHMQMLMHFLYTNIWTSTFCNPLTLIPGANQEAFTAPYKLALRNWRIIWDEIKAAAEEAEWNKLGFQRTAETYFDAVQAVLATFERREGRFPPLPSGCEKGNHLKRLLSF